MTQQKLASRLRADRQGRVSGRHLSDMGRQSDDDREGDRCYAGAMDVSLMDNKVGNLIASAEADAPGSVLPPARAMQGECRKQTWERLRQEARAAGMSKQDAYNYATREVDRAEPATEPPQPEPSAVAQPPVVASSGSGVDGLAQMPDGWPMLPSNASLQTEVGWVQANRLRVCRGESVDLRRSLSPAPSHAALGWLETSILYPAKFADVAVKAAQGQQDDDTGDVRREKIALDDMRTMLSEARATN